MFKRLTTSLTKPPRLIIYLKDSWKRAILYLFLLPLILVIPTIVEFIIQPGMSTSQYNALSTVIAEDFDIENSTITDGVFSTTITQTATFEYFQITTTKQTLNTYSMTFLLDEDALVLYVGLTEYRRMSYESLDLYNYTFDYSDPAQLNLFVSAIKTLYNSQSLTTYIYIFAAFIYALVDYIFIILLLTVMDYFLIVNQPFSFKLRFKMSIYLTTIYMFSELVFQLFGIDSLNIISIMAAYFYHLWFYRSIKIIPKGVYFNAKTK